MLKRAWWTVNGAALAYAAAAAAVVMLPAVGGSMAGAGVLVNDTWIDQDRTQPASPVYSENGVDADGDGDIESAWFLGGSNVTLVPAMRDTTPVLRGDLGDTTSSTSASWTTYATSEAEQITLQQGESLRVTWKFIPTNVNATNGSRNLRVALVDSPSAARVASDAAPGSAAYTGYGMLMNMGQTLGHSSSFRLSERTNPTTGGAFLSGSADWTDISATGATNGNDGYDDGVEYTFTMEVLRTFADELDVSASMSGGTLDNDGLATTSILDATPNGGSFTFDTFGLRPSGATTTAEIFDTTLFRMEHIVPEPTSLALLGLGGLAMLRRGRRQGC